MGGRSLLAGRTFGGDLSHRHSMVGQEMDQPVGIRMPSPRTAAEVLSVIA